MIAALAKITFQMKEEQEFKAPVVSDYNIKKKSTLEIALKWHCVGLGFFPKNIWLSPCL